MALPDKELILDGLGQGADDGCWWTASDEEIGARMVRVATRYETAQLPRRDQSRRYVQLYKGQIMPTSMFDAASPRDEIEDLHPCWNVIQAAVNTEQSVVTRNRVRIAIETDGADWELQEDAKEAELFVAGVFARNKLYEEIDPLWFMDADVPGLGCVIAEDTEDGQVRLERVIPDELVFSDQEAVRGKPRQIFRSEWMSKWEAISRYGDTPEHIAAIKVCNHTFNVPLVGSPDQYVPLIQVWTGWFLPSRAGMPVKASEKKREKGEEHVPLCDGRRVVAIAGADKASTLRVRKWPHTRFPMALLRIERSPAGLWGIGAAERLYGFQMRLNELNWDITEAARLGSKGVWLVNTASAVNDDEFTDEHGAIVHHTGPKPEFQAIDGIPKDLIQERDTTYAQALRERGLSEWTVGGTQPTNIESGEGLRMLRDQEQGRAVPAGQSWEGAHCDLAECIVLAASDAAERNPDLKVTVKDQDGDGLRTVQWKRIARLFQDPDSHLITCYPTANLPNTPTGRADKLWEWKEQGRIDAATYAALSEMPDLNQDASLQLAGVKAVRHAISQIVKRGADGYEPPEAYWPLGEPAGPGGGPKPGYGIKLAQATMNKGYRTGMPEDRLMLLKTWVDDAMAILMGKPAVPPVATPAAAGPVPVDPAAGAPPPVEAAPEMVPPAATVPPDGAPMAPGDLGAMPVDPAGMPVVG